MQDLTEADYIVEKLGDKLHKVFRITPQWTDEFSDETYEEWLARKTNE